MNIKLQVVARVLRIIQEKLEAGLPENMSESECYEQAIEIVSRIWN